MLVSPDLKPQVIGRLAETEQAIIKILTEGGGVFRSTISIEAPLALAAVRAAAIEKRDFSNFIAVVLEEYTKAHGPLSASEAEVLSKFQSALVDSDDAGRAKLLLGFERLIRTTSRVRRSKQPIPA